MSSQNPGEVTAGASNSTPTLHGAREWRPAAHGCIMGLQTLPGIFLYVQAPLSCPPALSPLAAGINQLRGPGVVAVACQNNRIASGRCKRLHQLQRQAGQGGGRRWAAWFRDGDPRRRSAIEHGWWHCTQLQAVTHRRSLGLVAVVGPRVHGQPKAPCGQGGRGQQLSRVSAAPPASASCEQCELEERQPAGGLRQIAVHAHEQ